MIIVLFSVRSEKSYISVVVRLRIEQFLQETTIILSLCFRVAEIGIILSRAFAKLTILTPERGMKKQIKLHKNKYCIIHLLT